MKDSVLEAQAWSVLAGYDHAKEPALQRYAYSVGMQECRERGDDLAVADLPAIFRSSHVHVWRRECVMHSVISALWDDEKIEAHRRYLMSRGVLYVNDVIQSATVRAMERFDAWRPWESSFITWFQWLTRDNLLRRKRRLDRMPEVAFPEDDAPLLPQLMFTENALAVPDAATVVLDKVIEELSANPHPVYKDMVRILQYARQQGMDFTSLFSYDLCYCVGLSVSQVRNRIEKSGLRTLVAKTILQIYGMHDMDAPLSLNGA